MNCTRRIPLRTVGSASRDMSQALVGIGAVQFLLGSANAKVYLLTHTRSLRCAR
jgi:hypothetical protein